MQKDPMAGVFELFKAIFLVVAVVAFFVGFFWAAISAARWMWNRPLF